MTYDGERFHAVAHRGAPAPFAEFLASRDFVRSRETRSALIVARRCVIPTSTTYWKS